MAPFNVFRSKLDGICCAVPEDCALPPFVNDEAWIFDRRLQADATPLGFIPSAAVEAVRLLGFYLFHPFDCVGEGE